MTNNVQIDGKVKLSKKPNLWRCILENFMHLKLSDVKRENNIILIAFVSSLGIRSLFHNIGAAFFLPEQIIDSGDINFFPKYERELIYACQASNDAHKFYRGIESHKICKVILDENISLFIYDLKNMKSYLKFEFNERKLAGLLKKYRSPEEVRKIISGIFTFI